MGSGCNWVEMMSTESCSTSLKQPSNSANRVFLAQSVCKSTSLSGALVTYLGTLSWRSMGRPPVQRLFRQ